MSSVKFFKSLLCAATVAVQLIDFKTTQFILQNGGVEVNPLVRYVIDNWGWGALLVVKVTIGTTLAWVTWSKPKVAILMLIPYVWLCVHNSIIVYRIVG